MCPYTRKPRLAAHKQVKHFNASNVVKWTKEYDTTRLVDTNSGGPANNLHVGDVNDIHSYPWPGNPTPSDTQYAMIGEFGGIGAFVDGHMWTPKGCKTYLHVDTPHDEAQTYVNMTAKIMANAKVSVSVYTQTTDLENECDGFLNYDRTQKFGAADLQAVHAANTALIGKPVDCAPLAAVAPPVGQAGRALREAAAAGDDVLNFRLY